MKRKNCTNLDCCKHGYCIKNGHAVESVMGHGFSTMCKTCGEIGLALPDFKDASLTQKLVRTYTKELSEELKELLNDQTAYRP